MSTKFPSKNKRILIISMLGPTLCWNKHQFFEHQASSRTNFQSKHEQALSYSMLDPILQIIVCRLTVLLLTNFNCAKKYFQLNRYHLESNSILILMRLHQQPSLNWHPNLELKSITSKLHVNFNNTRHFVNLISTQMPHVPFYDCNQD